MKFTVITDAEFTDEVSINQIERIIRSLVRITCLKITIIYMQGKYFSFKNQTLWGIGSLASTLKELTLRYYSKVEDPFGLEFQSLGLGLTAFTRLTPISSDIVQEIALPCASLTKLELLDTNLTVSNDISGIPHNLKSLCVGEYLYPEEVEFSSLENLTTLHNHTDNFPNAPLLTSLHAYSVGIDLSATLFSKYPKLKRLSLDTVNVHQFAFLIAGKSTTQLEALEISLGGIIIKSYH